MIENSAITGAVTNLRFTQRFLEAWKQGNVAGVSNDLRYADSEFGSGLAWDPVDSPRRVPLHRRG